MRLISSDGTQLGIVPREDALSEARSAGLDLVLIAPEAEPPVVKVMDYGKHLFDKKKAKAAQRKRQKQTHVKEVKFRPGTEEGDYQIKLRNLIRFLEEGDKTKISLRFKGREMAHPEFGRHILDRLIDELQDVAIQETMPRMEGNQMHTILSSRTVTKKGR